jgi:hypothetical protein
MEDRRDTNVSGEVGCPDLLCVAKASFLDIEGVEVGKMYRIKENFGDDEAYCICFEAIEEWKMNRIKEVVGDGNEMLPVDLWKELELFFFFFFFFLGFFVLSFQVIELLLASDCLKRLHDAEAPVWTLHAFELGMVGVLGKIAIIEILIL